MGDRLTVGLQTLTLPIGVRIPVPQPDNTKGFRSSRKPFFLLRLRLDCGCLPGKILAPETNAPGIGREKTYPGAFLSLSRVPAIPWRIMHQRSCRGARLVVAGGTADGFAPPAFIARAGGACLLFACSTGTKRHFVPSFCVEHSLVKFNTSLVAVIHAAKPLGFSGFEK